MEDTSEVTLFDIFCDLYDNEKYESLLEYCGRAIRNSRNDPQDLHLAYTFKALGQLQLSKSGLAIKNARKAVAIAPTCPWANWVLAYALEAKALKSHNSHAVRQAIVVAETLVNRGAKSLMQDPCMAECRPEGAQAIIADTCFLLGFLYTESGESARAIKMLERYVRDVEGNPELDSHFTLEEAKECLSALTAA